MGIPQFIKDKLVVTAATLGAVAALYASFLFIDERISEHQKTLKSIQQDIKNSQENQQRLISDLFRQMVDQEIFMFQMVEDELFFLELKRDRGSDSITALEQNRIIQLRRKLDVLYARKKDAAIPIHAP